MGKIKTPIEGRFWGKVDKEKSTTFYDGTRCWEWTGSRRNGYGRIYDFDLDTLVSAHRLSWKLFFGKYPSKEIKVLHKCDNPSCVNPNHLFLGSQQDNMDDMINKGRHRYPVGTKVHTNKLTEEDVVEIRKLSSTLSTNGIAEIYKVSKSAIKHILKGRSWSWLS